MVMEDNKIPKCGCCHTGENISETDFGYTLSLINGKYKMTILYTLMEFGVVRFNEMKKYIGNFTGKRILLPSSGDNHAAFAFALMGAKVTSADISERQLESARHY